MRKQILRTKFEGVSLVDTLSAPAVRQYGNVNRPRIGLQSSQNVTPIPTRRSAKVQVEQNEVGKKATRDFDSRSSGSQRGHNVSGGRRNSPECTLETQVIVDNENPTWVGVRSIDARVRHHSPNSQS
jgi:hypothetical protein